MKKKLKHRIPLVYKKATDFSYFFYPEGFLSGLNKLKRKKWTVLKRDLFNRRNRYWFLSFQKKVVESGRKKIKLSYKRRTVLFRSIKYFFENFRSLNAKKSVNFVFRRVKKQKNIFLINLFERRLVSVLFRARFFHRFSHAAKAIRRGDIYVNNKPIRSIHFILTIQDIIDVRGKSRTIIRELFYSFRKLAIVKAEVNLFPRPIVRSFSSPFTGLNRGVNLRTVLKRSFLRSELFFLKEIFRKNSPGRNFRLLKNKFRKSFGLWPVALEQPKIADYLLVDFNRLLIFFKTTVSPRFLSTFFHQNLCFSEFWRF